MRGSLQIDGRWALAAGLIVATAAPVAAQSSDRVERTFTREFERGAHRALVFDLNVGELQVAGADVDTISAEVRVRCSRRDRRRCGERAADVDLSSRTRDGKLYVTVEGTGMWRSRDIGVVVRLTMPEDLAVELLLGTGELNVENLAGDVLLEMDIGEASLRNLRGNVTVDMGIGDISVSMPQDAVREVTLDNGLGETELRHRDGRNAMEGILGGTDVHWAEGTGAHTVKIDLNVGEIRVRLE